MNTQPLAAAAPPPSARKLLVTTVIAIVVAGLVLVTAILPAEYGIDPLGVGRAFGLTAMSSPAEATEPVAAAPIGVNALIPMVDGPISRYNAEYKTDTRQLVLGPYEFVEYKYRLEKGATMLYAWKASAMPIYDFHADPVGTTSAVSFDKQAKLEESGAFTAPFSGIHGWYWENPGGETMTITLATAGFYSAATEFRPNRVRRGHALTPIGGPPAPPPQ